MIGSKQNAFMTLRNESPLFLMIMEFNEQAIFYITFLDGLRFNNCNT